MNNKENPVENKVLDTLESLVLEIPGLLREFIRAGISNPILGTASAILVSDILFRTGVIDKDTFYAVAALTGGASVAADATSILEAILPWDKSSNQVTPSATTVVFADQKDVRGPLVADMVKK